MPIIDGVTGPLSLSRSLFLKCVWLEGAREPDFLYMTTVRDPRATTRANRITHRSENGPAALVEQLRKPVRFVLIGIAWNLGQQVLSNYRRPVSRHRSGRSLIGDWIGASLGVTFQTITCALKVVPSVDIFT